MEKRAKKDVLTVKHHAQQAFAGRNTQYTQQYMYGMENSIPIFISSPTKSEPSNKPPQLIKASYTTFKGYDIIFSCILHLYK